MLPNPLKGLLLGKLHMCSCRSDHLGHAVDARAGGARIEAEATASQTRGGCSSWFTRSAETSFESSVRERRLDVKKASTPKDDQDIPEYTREQLGLGVRGKYAARYAKATNIVVIDPLLTKAFPNSEAVNDALRGLLTIAMSATRLTSRSKRPGRKRAAA